MKLLEKVGLILQYSYTFNKAHQQHTPESKKEPIIPPSNVLMLDTNFQKDILDPEMEKKVKD